MPQAPAARCWRRTRRPSSSRRPVCDRDQLLGDGDHDEGDDGDHGSYGPDGGSDSGDGSGHPSNVVVIFVHAIALRARPLAETFRIILGRQPGATGPGSRHRSSQPGGGRHPPPIEQSGVPEAPCPRPASEPGDSGAQCGKAVGVGAVARARTFDLPLHEPRFAEDAEVFGHRRLGKGQLGHQVTGDARLPVGEQAQDGDTRWMGDRFGQGGQRLVVGRRGAGWGGLQGELLAIVVRRSTITSYRRVAEGRFIVYRR